MKERYVLVGAGLQGQAIAYDLRWNQAMERLTVIDRDPAALAKIGKILNDPRAVLIAADCGNVTEMTRVFRDHDAVIVAASYELNLGLTQAAIEAGAHFCDLGGNNDIVESQFKLDGEAKKRGLKVIPDCGVAPGAVSIITRLGIDRLGTMPDSVQIRVGGLPLEPEGPLKYALVFSVRGLFNECLEPAEILRGGQPLKVPSLTGFEQLDFGNMGILEAVYTSGGSSTLSKTYAGKIMDLDYKTLRYPGHWQIWTTLRDLGYLGEYPVVDAGGASVIPRRLSEALFERNLPRGAEDMLVLRVTLKKGRQELRYEMADRFDRVTGHTAMQRTTGYSAAIIARMMVRGEIADTGVLRQEISVPAARFIDEWRKRGLTLRETSR